MRNFKNVFLIAFSVIIFLPSCLKNDIPYARIQANILEIEAEGQTSGAIIDSLNMTVNFYFPEQTDLAKVKIASYKVAENVLSPTTISIFNISVSSSVTGVSGCVSILKE